MTACVSRKAQHVASSGSWKNLDVMKILPVKIICDGRAVDILSREVGKGELLS